MKKLTIILFLFIDLFVIASSCGANIKSKKPNYEELVGDKLKFKIYQYDDGWSYSLHSLSEKCTKVRIQFEDGAINNHDLQPLGAYNGVCFNHNNKIIGVNVCDWQEELYRYQEDDLRVYIGIDEYGYYYVYAINKNPTTTTIYFLLENEDIFVLEAPPDTETEKWILEEGEIIKWLWFSK